MNLRLTNVALAAALNASFAWSQAAPATPHQGHHPAQAGAKAATSAAPSPPSSAYRSPFADYRPFAPDEPPKDWRQANDEVREAGGHVGLMKSVAPKDSPPQGHGAHGAKQQPAKAGKP